MIINKMFTTDSRINFSYHFVIIFYLNSLMTTLTRTIILRIKDQSNYQIKGKIIRNKFIQRKRKYITLLQESQKAIIGNI